MKASVAGYAVARSVSDAVDLLAAAQGQGRVIAGGQSLIAALNLGTSTGDRLVDISRIAELRGVTVEGDHLVIGALTRHVDLATNALIAEHAPLLAQAAPLVAHDAIRNRGTIGGSLAHADPAAEYPACVVALDATIVLHGPAGEREVAAEAFFQGVFETAAGPDEVLVRVRVPRKGAGELHVIREAARRAGDYALAGLAVVRRGSSHRVAAFGVGATPILCRDAMSRLDAGDVDGAASALAAEIDPADDTQASASYRRHLAGVLLRRIAAGMERAEA